MVDSVMPEPTYHLFKKPSNSALWRETKPNPSACQSVLEESGVYLFEKGKSGLSETGGLVDLPSSLSYNANKEQGYLSGRIRKLK